MTFRLLTKITPIQGAALWITTIGLSNHVFIKPILLNTAGRDSWIGALLFKWRHGYNRKHGDEQMKNELKSGGNNENDPNFLYLFFVISIC
jgi:hypothetical protein